MPARKPTTAAPQGPPPFLIGIDEVARLTSRSASSIRRDWRAGLMPSPVSVGSRSKRWRRPEVMAWMKAGCPALAEWEARWPRKVTLPDRPQDDPRGDALPTNGDDTPADAA